MNRRIRVFVLALLAVALAVGVAVQGASALPNGKAAAVGLKAIRDVAVKTLSAQKALDYTAYPYLGWRTNGGPWFNASLDWLAGNLEAWGFAEGKDAQGAHYWFQTDVPAGRMIWAPQYAALEVVGPGGDPVAGQGYNFDFAVATFDPTSPYYPASITYDWLLKHIGTPAEAAMNDRCHLASNSGFSSPAGTPLAEAQAAAPVGQLVDVGVVTYNRTTKIYSWDKNTGVSLKGKFIYAAYDFATETGTSRGNLYGLAVQEGAAGSLSPQINAYNNPIIEGKQLFPNTVKYAGVTNSKASNPLAFNISPMDAAYLEGLLAKGPVTLKGMAIGSMQPMSAEKPLRTLIAEIPGTAKAAERVVLLGHLQEPGACDNASGVGLQLEIARTLKSLFDRKALPAPQRTFTFIWGAETIMGSLWKGQNEEAFNNTKAALVLDMVGEDPAKTGGSMRIEKMPDPSAVYQYGLDTLPGQAPEPVDAYVRQPDMHTLWGAGELEFAATGHFLNDLYFEAADLVSAISPKFVVGSNPWEGGSDHDTFLWNTDANGDPDPKPAVLTWHFTDYVYHTSMDTMGMVSARELRDVGLTTVEVGCLVAMADETQARQLMQLEQQHAAWRFGWERMNSLGSLNWSYDQAVAASKTPAEIEQAVQDALASELEILGAWGDWYKEAVTSPRQLLGAQVSIPYANVESEAVRCIERLTSQAEANAESIAAKLIAGIQ